MNKKEFNKKMPQSAQEYLNYGCGRCHLGGTPQCKVHDWTAVLHKLRELVLACQLSEEIKWGVPCYTFNQKNIVMISALKTGGVLTFFKGSLLTDEHQLLRWAGEHSRIAKLIQFTDARQVEQCSGILQAYIYEAIEIEKSGIRVAPAAHHSIEIPPEFQQILDDNPTLKAAFYALSPGRQRGYLIHFSGAKQSATRRARIEKCIPKILSGKGFHD